MRQDVDRKVSIAERTLVSTLIGIVSGFFSFWLMRRTHLGAGDFTWAIHMAQRLVARQNPYDEVWQIYPLTAAFFGLPFVRVPPEIAAGIFYGFSSGVLALGLTREGYHRLLIFLAYPYWIGMLYVQWSPLIAASAFFPFLLPATMAKPQVGIPVFVSRFSLRGLWACICVAAASLVVFPRWPLFWFSEIGKYQHFYAILVLPGPLILLALLRYRDPDAILLLLTACMPQRWFFDTFTLWLIPRSRREILIATFFSWCAGIWRWYHFPHSMSEVGRWVVIFTYIPMLTILLFRQRASDSAMPGDAKC
jgi:hypothetical protein